MQSFGRRSFSPSPARTLRPKRSKPARPAASCLTLPLPARNDVPECETSRYQGKRGYEYYYRLQTHSRAEKASGIRQNRHRSRSARSASASYLSVHFNLAFPSSKYVFVNISRELLDRPLYTSMTPSLSNNVWLKMYLMYASGWISARTPTGTPALSLGIDPCEIAKARALLRR